MYHFNVAKCMEVNVRKTEIVVFLVVCSARRLTPEVPGQWLYKEETVPRPAAFCYLGIILHKTRGLSSAIKPLATVAHKAVWALFPMFNVAGITDVSIEMRMSCNLVGPIMEYCGGVSGPVCCSLLIHCHKLWMGQ